MARLPERESLTVELKSDRRRLPDRELVAAAVCLANTEGGVIYLGVEKDGRVTGLHEAHADLTGLAAMIANRTVPPLGVRVTAIEEGGKTAAAIEVPRSSRLVATSEGLLQHRRLQADGTPECVPFYPHEFPSREADLGVLDYSALPVEGATTSDFDPLERTRLRQMVERYGGDRTLLNLADAELDGALGFVETAGRRRVPTVAGLLLLGTEAALRRHVPTHEAAFQVLEGTRVKVNEFHRTPLLRLFERVMGQFTARVSAEEMQVGLFRVPVPDYEERAFREALVNALVHRDYTRLGACHVRWETDAIVISNPGGFVEGVTLQNLLVVEPRPRNPRLADAVKRVGLAERTGRGVDLIYQGLLRYGRPPPDYARSDAHGVVVGLPGGEADLGLLRIVLAEEERSGRALPVEALLALGRMRRERRVDVASLAPGLGGDEARARAVMERLVEAGLAEAHGIKRGRTYTLSARLYRELGLAADYVRQAGFDRMQQEEMVLKFARKHGRIARADVVSLCRIGPDQASRLLRNLVKSRKLKLEGKKRGAFYRPA